MRFISLSLLSTCWEITGGWLQGTPLSPFNSKMSLNGLEFLPVILKYISTSQLSGSKDHSGTIFYW